LRRLNTDEDALNLHKWSNLGYVITSTSIVAAGATVGFQTVPDFLEPLTYLFVGSTIGQAVSGIRMAEIHRRNDPENRKFMMASSIQAIQLALIALWIAPFSPEFLGNEFCTFSILVLYNLACVVANVVQAVTLPFVPEFSQSKQKVGDEPEAAHPQYWLKLALCLGPVILFLPFQMWSFILIGHDRQWYIDACLQDNLPFAPHVDLAWGYYAQLFMGFSITYPSFLTTLIDKKLIQKDVAVGINTVLSALGVYASVHGLGYI
jgi:hypothetical protein